MEEGVLALPEAPVVDPVSAIVVRIRAGEVDAFEDLMALTEQRILGVAWRILGDRDLARDAAQETYLRVFKSLDSFRTGERFEAWMIRIAVHVCYDLARKRGPRMLPQEALEDTSLIQETAGAEEAVLHQQRRSLMRQALAQ
jgi:RNA polymerase sigma-70 factor (ECF subfamily)